MQPYKNFLPLALFFALGAFLFTAPSFVLALTIPQGFQVQLVTSGLTLPTQMAFAPDGSLYIAEKNGSVRHFKDGVLRATPVITLSDVNNYGDRGLLGLALDPNFTANGFMYLMYTHENSPGFNYTGSKTARIVRVTVVGDTASESSAVVLVGSISGDRLSPSCNNFATTSDCIPVDSETHAGGGLRFGPDGKLYASIGDGAEFAFADENARRALNLDSLAGKILRINADGTAPSDNPYYNGDPRTNRSKVFAYGLRNPLRFSFRPLNNRLYFGDVGWYAWEEINLGVSGGNYGWPCREGNNAVHEYNCAVSNPVNPLFVYDHSLGTGSVIGGVFPEKDAYPAEYMQSYFFGDYSLDRVYRLSMGASDNLLSSEIFIEGAGGPVDFQVGPDGTIYYLGIYGGDVRRIVFSTANRPPFASISASPSSGPSAPLTVNFSSFSSSDPDGDALSYSWDFGDGDVSSAANPSHTYVSTGTYSAKLTVSDGRGGSASAFATISVGVPPPAVAPFHQGTTVDPNPALIGRNALLTTTIENRGASGPVNIDFEIYDQNGAKVAQKVYEGETIGTNTARTFTFNWFPPTVGSYRVAIGIFRADWSGMYEWTNEALSIEVMNRAPTGVVAPVHQETVVTPITLSPGAVADIQTTVRNDGDTGRALVDIEVYKGGVKVGQKFFDNELFDAGASRAFGYQFVPQTAGDYSVSVGIFKPAWAGVYSWQSDVRGFTAGTATGTLSIYADALASGWENWSWDTALNFSATPAKSGTAALGVTFSSPWAGLYFHHTPFSLTGKSTLSFAINGGSSGAQHFQLIPFDEAGTALPAKNLDVYGDITQNQWKTFDIPLADLGLSGKNMVGFALQGNNGAVQNPFLIDDIVIR